MYIKLYTIFMEKVLGVAEAREVFSTLLKEVEEKGISIGIGSRRKAQAYLVSVKDFSRISGDKGLAEKLKGALEAIHSVGLEGLTPSPKFYLDLLKYILEGNNETSG